MPAAFRRALGEEGYVVVTQLDSCLAVYPPGEWSRLETQLAQLPAFSRPVKALTRLVASRAADCEIDGQGRILLPPALRAAAGLARDAVVIGVLNRIEVWAPEAWDGFVRESEKILDDASLEIQWPPPPQPPAPPSPGRPASGDPQPNSKS